jgi:hypothetical protein
MMQEQERKIGKKLRKSAKLVGVKRLMRNKIYEQIEKEVAEVIKRKK